jgi:TolB protein
MGFAAVVGLALVGWFGKGLLEEKPLQITVARNVQLTRTSGVELGPAISPDGREVAFVAGPVSAMRLYLQDTEARSAVALVPGLKGFQRGPLWTADGRTLAFSSFADGAPNIRTVSRSGGAIQTVSDSCCSWDIGIAPDSVSLVAFAAGVLARVSTSTRDSVYYIITDRPGNDPHSPRVSPDGRLVAYVDGNRLWWEWSGNIAPSTIKVVPLEGGQPREIESGGRMLRIWDGQPLAVSDSTSINVSPVWLPDSRHILYVSNMAGSRDVYLQRLTATGAADSPPVRVTAADAHSISISRDGHTLAYSKFILTRNVWRIAIPQSGSVSLSEATRVTTGNQVIESSTASPDGEWLAFDSDLSGNFDIYRQRIDGGEPIQVTRDPGGDFVPAWSPDGREIAFHSNRNGNRDIFVIDAEGGAAPVQVSTSPHDDWNPSWGPDGNSLAFSTNSGPGALDAYIVRRDADGNWGEPEFVIADALTPRWSPDGRGLSYRSSNGSSVAAIALGGTSRTLWTVASTRQTVMQTHWARDGLRIYFFLASDTATERGIWSVPLAGGEATRTVRFDDPSEDTGSVWGSFGTDGDNFYLTVGRIDSDIWVMELEY